MTSPPRVLILEDNAPLLANYLALLEGRGYQASGETATGTFLAALRAEPADLIVLDIAIGHDFNAGFDVCRAVRAEDETTPILFLTSHDSLPDKVSALRLGGDDFIAKHEDPEFLLAKVAALLRRASLRGTPSINAGSLHLDGGSLRTTWRERPVPLSISQFNLVRSLASTPGSPRTFDELMNAAETVVERNTIATHIMDIRARFKEVDPDFDSIQSVRGKGYVWVLDS